MSAALFKVTLSQRARGMPERLFFEPANSAAETFEPLDLGGGVDTAAFLFGYELWTPNDRDGRGTPRRQPVAIAIAHIVTMRPASANERASFAPQSGEKVAGEAGRMMGRATDESMCEPLDQQGAIP